MHSIGHKVYKYHVAEPVFPILEDGVQWINPFSQQETKVVFETFNKKYFSDTNARIYLLGINPGRFGAGVTGIPFTDPVRLSSVCGIDHSFDLRRELSSVFIYEVIEAFGGLQSFYDRFNFSSVCPFGFIKAGKNYNYYDDPKLYATVKPMIDGHLHALESLGADRSAVICLGKGKNYKYLKQLNDEHNLFERVEVLPHPRWVMQYRLKEKLKHIDHYIKVLNQYR